MKEQTYYAEAMRYIDNAKEQLQKTKIEDGFYVDEKYVKSAGGIAYAGLEKAAKWYLRLNDYKGSLKSNYDILTGLAKYNYKAQKLFNTAYSILHRDVYYNDDTNVIIIKEGFHCATDFINLLKPYNGKILEADLRNIKKRRLSRKSVD